MARRIFRKFDMQSFIGTVGLAAVFVTPGAVLLSNDSDDRRAWALLMVVGLIAMAAVVGIVGHLVVEAAEEKKVEETRPRPNLECDEPRPNVRLLIAADPDGKMQNREPEPATFVNQKWRNMPAYFGSGADAPNVLADVEYYVGDSQVPIRSPGRWGCCKPQPAAQGLMAPIEQGTVDFPANGKEHDLDIAIRYSNGESYVYNDETQRNPRIQAHRLGDNNLVHVQLRGNNIKQSYWFRLRHEGEGFVVEPMRREEIRP